MPKYQITIVVDVMADDVDEAAIIGENLEGFLGQHHWTESQGCVTEITELVEEDSEEDLDEIPEDEDFDYDPMDDVNYVGHPIHY